MAALRLFAVAAVLCGAALLVQANRNARIISGVARDIKDAPWMVQMVFEYKEYKANAKPIHKPWCGGVIVSERHILTSAHCVVNKSVRESVKMNPEYAKKDGFLWWGKEKLAYRHDIAVLETVKPIQFTDKVQPIKISKEKPAGETKVYVAGWGNNNTGTVEEVACHPDMHIATMKVVPDKECGDYLKGVTLDEESKKWLICLSGIDGGFCQGDSGGAIWSHNEGQPPLLIGLVQSGVSCHLHEHGLIVDIADPEITKFLRKNKDGSYAPTLLTFEMEKRDPEDCKQELAYSSIDEPSKVALMCMRPGTGMPCAGDSGSGVWLPGNKPELIGLLHGGNFCNTEGGLPLYVDILHEDIRPFLSKHFDMSGFEVTKSLEPAKTMPKEIMDMLAQLGR